MSKVKLNIFALPSQTTLLFGLMITVLLGAVLLGSLGSSPILIWPLALGLLLLPLRAFLARPGREFNRHDIRPAGKNFLCLQQAVETSAQKIGLTHSPKLMINPHDGPLHTIGTFRHWYVVTSHQEALNLEEKLADSARASTAHAKIIHELYHFKTGDYWKMGYVGELLRLTFLFIGWAIAFFFGFGLLLVVAAPDVLQMNPPELVGQIDGLTPEIRQAIVQMMPSAAEIVEVRQKAVGINMSLVLNFILSAFLPLVLVGLVLWRFYWPKLWRTREFYADAGVVRTQGEIMPFFAALMGLSLPSLRKYPDTIPSTLKAIHRKKTATGWLARWEGINIPRGRFFRMQPQYGAFSPIAPSQSRVQFPGRKKLAQIFKPLTTVFRALLAYHPDDETRLFCVSDPGQVFDSWFRTAILVGSLTLLLDILLSSPLTLIHVGNWPMHFSSLIVMITVSIGYLIPALVRGRSVWLDVVKIVGVVAGLRLLWLLPIIAILFFSLIFAPEFLDEMLQHAVASIAHYAGNSVDLGFDDLTGFVVQASFLNLAQVFIIFFVLLA
ncbi:MAG: hypothetical protein KJ638_00630, partial [Chloroflexi bacterium]|nr:hypothetical protein [Chloroflexota bacterium]